MLVRQKKDRFLSHTFQINWLLLKSRESHMSRRRNVDNGCRKTARLLKSKKRDKRHCDYSTYQWGYTYVNRRVTGLGFFSVCSLPDQTETWIPVQINSSHFRLDAEKLEKILEGIKNCQSQRYIPYTDNHNGFKQFS